MLFKIHSEKILLGASCVAVALGIGWSWARTRGFSPRPLAVEWSREQYRAAVLPAAPAPGVWAPPAAQPAGAAWIFEVFAPPLIHRDQHTGVFRAGMPRGEASGVRAVAPDLKLLAIHAAPFRVQLQGSFGPPDNRFAMLVAIDTREVWCARPGDRWAALGVVLERLDLRHASSEATAQAASTPAAPWATIADERTGGTILLGPDEPALTDKLVARVQMSTSARTRSLGEGDAWTEGNAVYRIERLNLDPAWAEISWSSSSGAASETLRLCPGAITKGSVEAGEPRRMPDLPAIITSSQNGP
jgi:hypothetical protein